MFAQGFTSSLCPCWNALVLWSCNTVSTVWHLQESRTGIVTSATRVDVSGCQSLFVGSSGSSLLVLMLVTWPQGLRNPAPWPGFVAAQPLWLLPFTDGGSTRLSWEHGHLGGWVWFPHWTRAGLPSSTAQSCPQWCHRKVAVESVAAEVSQQSAPLNMMTTSLQTC